MDLRNDCVTNKNAISFFFSLHVNPNICSTNPRGEENGKKERKKVMHVEKRLRNEYSISLNANDRKSIDQANHLRKLAAKNILRSIFINQSIVYLRLNQT